MYLLGFHDGILTFNTTPLMNAARGGHIEDLQLLLDQSDIDVNEGAPLALAAAAGHTEVVELLLARPDIDVNNEAPLYFASNADHNEVVELLLAHPDIDPTAVPAVYNTDTVAAILAL